MFNETLHIAKILRTQGGRYYCKAENGLGSPAIKSIRVDVYCKCADFFLVHEGLFVLIRRRGRIPGKPEPPPQRFLFVCFQ